MRSDAVEEYAVRCNLDVVRCSQMYFDAVNRVTAICVAGLQSCGQVLAMVNPSFRSDLPLVNFC